MHSDTPGVAGRTLQQVRTWLPGLPVFGLLTPFTRDDALIQAAGGRRTAHAPSALEGFRSVHNGSHSAEDDDRRSACRTELRWAQSYSPEALAQAVAALDDHHVGDRINIFLARLCFRGIHFPMVTKSSWLRVIVKNRRKLLRLFKEGVFRWMRLGSDHRDTYAAELICLRSSPTSSRPDLVYLLQGVTNVRFVGFAHLPPSVTATAASVKSTRPPQ